jgi:metal-responsive CopG/Arc/MetJ family transcriptional regulator
MTDKPETYRTKTGRVLTDVDIQALADEAERGYDVEHLAKGPGRPRMGSAPAMVVPVRLHADLLAALKVMAAAESTSLSELVRDALRVYLGGEPPVVADLRTASGRVITDAEIDALATAAEAGYDTGAPSGRPSRRGRPRAEVVPVRMPPELKAEVERRAEAESTSVSEIVREALRARLGGDDNPPSGGARHRAGRHGPAENRAATGQERGTPPAEDFHSVTRASQRRWDVALSFADAQRDYVSQVAQALQARGVRCFYDADEQSELWGKDLIKELSAIYDEQAAAVVVFVSAEYAARDWTRLERRAALGRAVRERREYVLPARFDDTPLPGLLSDMVTVDLRRRAPQQFAAVIADKLAAFAIAGAAAGASAGDPDGGTRRPRPAGAVRVREADPQRLGVHVAISMSGVPDEVPPEYVPRDADAGIRAKIAAAAQQGGFLLLVGGSSVGKTRSAVEAVKELLPDWWLVHPAGPTEVAALAAAPSPRTVVWLDELQRYLDGEHGLTAAVVRALLNAPHPAVIIGTLWPDRYTAYTALPALGGTDPHAQEREVLDLGAVIQIGPEFSLAEQDRARAIAARDRRLAVALDSTGYGLPQTLAAAPLLIARWQAAGTASPYERAVLTAALDAARLGTRAPLSADFLRAAASGYCTSQQQAEAPGNWFEQAMAYATGKLRGAMAALSPAEADTGQGGYIAADYLVQHASRERLYARVPASIWDAAISHIGNSADAARLADSARNRLLYYYAIPLYRHAADAGNRDAAFRLAELLAERGDLAEVHARVDTGDTGAARALAERGDLDGAEQILRARADAGDEPAAWELARLLAERGDLDELSTRADAGDGYAAWELAELLAEHGDLDGAEQILRARADASDGYAAWELADLLAGRGDLEELRARADAGDGYAAWGLAKLLAERGGLEELRARADAGNWNATRQLVDLLTKQGPG